MEANSTLTLQPEYLQDILVDFLRSLDFEGEKVNNSDPQSILSCMVHLHINLYYKKKQLLKLLIRLTVLILRFPPLYTMRQRDAKLKKIHSISSVSKAN